MLCTQRLAKLGHIGNQSAKPSNAEVTQSSLGCRAMPTVINRVDHKPGRIQRL